MSVTVLAAVLLDCPADLLLLNFLSFISHLQIYIGGPQQSVERHCMSCSCAVQCIIHTILPPAVQQAWVPFPPGQSLSCLSPAPRSMFRPASCCSSS